MSELGVMEDQRPVVVLVRDDKPLSFWGMISLAKRNLERVGLRQKGAELVQRAEADNLLTDDEDRRHELVELVLEYVRFHNDGEEVDDE